ncbi:transposase [Streptomyces sp. V4I8]
MWARVRGRGAAFPTQPHRPVQPRGNRFTEEARQHREQLETDTAEKIRQVEEAADQRVADAEAGRAQNEAARQVVNAIFCQNRTGCQWRCLPHDFPAWPAVFYSFRLWREDGLDQRIQDLLRCQVRERARRLEDPSLVILDTSPSARPRVSRRARRDWTPTRKCRGASGDWPSTFWG